MIGQVGEKYVTKSALVIESIAYAIWIGSGVGFAAVVAPSAFATIHDLEVFRQVIGLTIRRLLFLGVGCGIAAILANAVSLACTRTGGSWLRLGLLALMLLLTGIEHSIVSHMNTIALAAHAHLATLPATSRVRHTYDALHVMSTRIYGAVLILGMAAFVLRLLDRGESGEAWGFSSTKRQIYIR